MTLFGGQQPMGVEPKPQNGLGVAAFVVSMIGLFVTGGLACPIGVVLGLVAMGRQPRGFAVAGLVIGLIGSCGIIIAGLVFGATILAMLGLAVAAVVLSEPQTLEITSDMINMSIAIKAYEKENDYLPANLRLLDLEPHVLKDPWQKDYQYELLDVDQFDLVSAGADGTYETADDIRLSRLNETWQAGGLNFKVSEHDDTVRIEVGDLSLTASDDGGEGTVSIDLGDRVIEIVGSADGASIDVVPDVPGEPNTEPDTEPDEGDDADKDAKKKRNSDPPPP